MNTTEKCTLVRLQLKLARDGEHIPCGGCGRESRSRSQFRCYYCGIWYCKKCSAAHFGGARKAFVEAYPA